MNRITSRKNPMVARYRSIANGEAPDMVLLDGPHLVADALRAGIRFHQVAMTAEALERPEGRALLTLLTENQIEIVTAAPPVMAALSPLRSSSGLVAIADRPTYDQAQLYSAPAPLVLLAADVQDPGNVGALIRVAEAGGATGVVTAGASADPFGWKALRGSMGSAFRLPIVVDKGSARHPMSVARRHRCRILATVPRGGRSLFEEDLVGALAVLIGSEGAGLSPAVVDAADGHITIPMQPPVESLNAAVTAAVIVYEARRQRGPSFSSR